MYMNTPHFKFLDISNYLSPGITYDKWVKTYGAKQTKSWFPYEWFDSADKLDYKGLPPYWCWYSQLKNSFALTPAEYEECKRVFKERGMQTFGDWLEYYNNLDVTPFLETLEKMKAFYTKLGIDIFKDAVSLPAVSIQYILRGTLRGRDPPKLYAPSSEAYEMLKGDVVGGPSLVFTRKHVAGQTKIRSHKYDLARTVKRILGFDANSLYPSTMAKGMPRGKETVVHYEDPVQAAKELIPRLHSKRWFGFAEVDIDVPRDLWEGFEEFPPIFLNQSVGEEGIPQHMKDYLAKSGRSFLPDQKKLLGVLKAKMVLLYAALLEWLTTVLRSRPYIARSTTCPEKSSTGSCKKQPTCEGKVMLKQKKLCSLKCTSFWATVPTASLSKPLSVRQKCYTRKTKTLSTSTCAWSGLKISKRSAMRTRSNPAKTRSR